jgi:hypothetical protein
MNRSTYRNEVWNSERSWTYLKLLFYSLSSFTEFLNMVMTGLSNF